VQFVCRVGHGDFVSSVVCVQFMCREGHGDFVSSVDERHTCSYVVTVHTSRLCSHPLFAPPPTVKSLPISCNPLLSPVDYEMYLKGESTLLLFCACFMFFIVHFWSH